MAYSIADLRNRVRARQYVVTNHAADELEDDNLRLFDLENIVLTGAIVRRTRDPETHEIKYVICGRTRGNDRAETVTKIGFTGALVFITVYVL